MPIVGGWSLRGVIPASRRIPEIDADEELSYACGHRRRWYYKVGKKGENGTVCGPIFGLNSQDVYHNDKNRWDFGMPMIWPAIFSKKQLVYHISTPLPSWSDSCGRVPPSLQIVREAPFQQQRLASSDGLKRELTSWKWSSTYCL